MVRLLSLWEALRLYAISANTKDRQRKGRFPQDGFVLAVKSSCTQYVLIRVDPRHLVQRWRQCHAQQHENLAIDGKTMCTAIDVHGHQTHIMSVSGHQRRRPQPDPHGSWPGEHHATPPLCHWHHQIQQSRAQCRAENTTPHAQRTHGLRLFAHVSQLMCRHF